MDCISSCSSVLICAKPHVLLGHDFGDCFRVQEVVLIRFPIGFHELGGNQPHLMPLFLQCSSHEVCTCASLKADE